MNLDAPSLKNKSEMCVLTSSHFAALWPDFPSSTKSHREALCIFWRNCRTRARWLLSGMVWL